MQKQKFYIIGHNPNTLREAEEFLRAGANALEPDICYDATKPERFFVSHGTIGSNKFIPENSLVTYLTGLREMLAKADNRFNLSLIAFDTKTPAFDINDFLRIVFDSFSSHPVCSDVAILVTVGSLSDISFLNAYDRTREWVGVGIDEENSPRDVEAAFRAGGQRAFTYANGNLIPTIKFGLFKSIMTAKAAQAASGDGGFKLIYAWVLNRDAYIRSYMDLHIDGMIVDVGTVPHLLEILSEDYFATRYELARRGYNPFTAHAPTRYLLTLRTRDAQWAGTDVPVIFSLEGSAGTLESTLDSDFRDVMERGETDYLTLEGEDIGTIRSLTVEQRSEGLNAGWLPESIRLESALLSSPLTFHYGPEEWVRLGQPVTKRPG